MTVPASVVADRIALYAGDVGTGAFRNVCAALSKGLIACGKDVDVVYLKGPRDDARFPPEATRIELGASRSLFAAVPLARYLRRRAPEALISIGWLQNPGAVVARSLSRWRGALVLTEHGHVGYEAGVEHGDKPLFRNIPRLARVLYPRADAIVAVQQEILDDLIDGVGVDVARVRTATIPNPIDLAMIHELAREPVDHPWITDETCRTIVSLGRLAPQKGHETLIDALVQVREHHDARLILLGDGPCHEDLARRADEAGVAKVVDLKGNVENPYPYMRAADVFVLPSKKEGFPLALLEALACGCAIVATASSGGPSEILDDGRYGVLTPVDDPYAMADAIAALLDDDARRMTLGRAAAERSAAFGPEEIGRRWSSFLGSLRVAATEAAR